MSEINYTKRYTHAIRLVEKGVEVWRDIREYEGLYEVSSFGRVKSLARIAIRKDGTTNPIKERILKMGITGSYLLVGLHRDGGCITRPIHRLVLENFFGPCPEGMECCHNDGDGNNNKLDNLRWDTKSGNMQDAIRHGTFHSGLRGSKGVENIKAKLNDDKVREIRKLYATRKYSQSQLGRQYGVGQDTISSIVTFDTWKHIL